MKKKLESGNWKNTKNQKRLAKIKVIPPEDKDRLVIIGNKPDFLQDPKTGQMVPTEPYLKTILKKLSEYDYIYIQLFTFPEKLSKIEEYYRYFRKFGIKRLDAFDIDVHRKDNPNITFMKARIYKWAVIPRVMQYREDLSKEEPTIM